MQEGERASSLLPQEDNPADKGKGLRTQKKGKAGAGRGQMGKTKKMSLLGPTALARGEHSLASWHCNFSRLRPTRGLHRALRPVSAVKARCL